jgi:hypothetical protein
VRALQVYGSSGHLRRPGQSTLQAYHACLPREHPENHNIKTIANMAYAECSGGSSHMFLYLVCCRSCQYLLPDNVQHAGSQ